MKLSIIIPVYNEARSLNKNMQQVKDTAKKIRGCEIIYIDDCSKDNSYTLLKKGKGIRVLRHQINKGYGASLKTGIKAAKGEWIAIADADGTYPIKDIPKLLKYMPQYDMVVGSRTGANVNIPLQRKPAKWFLNKFASFLAGKKIPDLNSGLRVFRKDIALEFWNLFPQRFSFTSTITMACMTNGYQVKYIPINYFKRKGKSSISPFDFYNFTNLLLRLTLFFKPLKIFGSLAILLLLGSIFVFVYSTYFLGRFMDTTTLVLFMSSLQMLSFGLLAHIVINRR
ncbi:glycosyltransferase family 2 protein [Nanoarchaeota archaeon]